MILSILLVCGVSYLLGNLNGAILLSRLVEKDDVRCHGSGNAGFTNFFRSYGRATSLLVILIDGLKAAAACLIGGALLGFKGGKGIVCGFAAAMATDWRIGLILLAIFAAAYFSTKYVSLASCLSALGFGVCFVLFYPGHPAVWALAVAMAALALFLHRENIDRLLHGKERKTDFFKKEGNGK